MGLFKKHWRAVLGGAALLPSLWRGLVWLFDWGARVDLVITKLSEHGGIAAVIEFLINPPPWFIFPAIIIGLLLIWWDTARRQKRIIVGDQANFRGIVGDHPLIGNPSSSRPIASETITSRDHHWQFDLQMAVAIAARLRSTSEWQDKRIVDVTPEHIWNLFRRGSTTMEGETLTRRFLNEWMVVCGPFGDVKRLLGNIMVVRSAIRNDLTIVFMYFNEESHDALELLIPNQKISVIGRIDLIKNDSLNLEDCKLIQ